MSFRGVKGLQLVLIFGLLIPSVYFSVHLPIFTDEVAWKWITSRWWSDGGYSISLYPQCSISGQAKIPLMFVPVRIVDSLLYGTPRSIFLLRYIGVCFCFLWFMVLYRFIKVVSTVRQVNKMELLTVTLTISLFGVLPFILVMNRPEQILRLCMTTLVCLPLIDITNELKRFVIAMGFLFLSLMLFAQHAKSLFFLPVVVFTALNLKMSIRQRQVLLVTAMSFSIQGYLFFMEHTKCTNDFIKSAFGKMMISPETMLVSPTQAIGSMVANGLRFGDYVKGILFFDNYPEQWLPENYGFAFGTKILNVLMAMFFVAWVVASCWGIIRKSIWKREAGRGLFLSDLGLVVLLSLGGLAVCQTSKSFYESALVIPIVIVVGISCINIKVIQVLAKISLVLATASVCLVGYRFWPILKNDWTGESALSRQEYSVKSHYQRAIKDRALSLAARCGIQDSNIKRHLVVDDLTYPYFINTVEPYHAVYVLGWWGKMSIPSPDEFLKARNSSGVLSQCKWLPESMLGKAFREGDLCCLPTFGTLPSESP